MCGEISFSERKEGDNGAQDEAETVNDHVKNELIVNWFNIKIL